jgi:hypothetical protein
VVFHGVSLQAFQATIEFSDRLDRMTEAYCHRESQDEPVLAKMEDPLCSVS